MPKALHRAALSAWICLAAISCTTGGDSRPDFSDVTAKYEARKVGEREPAHADISPACNTTATPVVVDVEPAQCVIAKERLDDMLGIIKEQNSELDDWHQAWDAEMDAHGYCQLQKSEASYQVGRLEAEMTKREIINTAKGVAHLAICAGGILWK